MIKRRGQVIAILTMTLIGHWGSVARVDAYEIHGVEIKPMAIVSEAYDDNVSFVKHDRQDDWVSHLGVGADISYKGEISQWKITGSITENIFANNRDFNNASEDFDLNYQRRLSENSTWQVSDVFLHAEEPRSFADAFASVIGRYSYNWNRFQTEYLRSLNKQWRFLVRYGNEVYLSSRKDIVDSYQNKVGTEWTYALNPTVTLLGSFDFFRRDFRPGSDVFFYSPAVGLRNALTKQLSFEARVGPDVISDRNDRERTEPNFFVSITNQLNAMTQAGCSFVKRHETNLNDSDLFDFWRLEWTLQRNLTKKLIVALNHFYGSGEYADSNVKESFHGIAPSLSYAIEKDTQVNFSYSYSHVTSDDEGREYLKNVVFLGLKKKF